MAPRGVFSQTLDSTADLNLRFTKLVAQGVYSGGRVSVNTGSYTVTVDPYFAMTKDGMLVMATESTYVVVPSGSLQYLVIDAVYNPSGPATVLLKTLNEVDYNNHADRYICICTVDLSSNPGSILPQYISYAKRDQVTPVQDSKFLGYFLDDAARNTAYPSTVPCKQRIGDFAVVGTTASDLKFCLWSSSGWADFQNPAEVAVALDNHIGDANAHITPDLKAALQGTTTAQPSGTNKFVTAADTHLLKDSERAAITGALGSESGLGILNPLVAQGTVIAVPRVFQVAISGTGINYIDLNASTLITPSPCIYVGKQGIDSNSVSSAVQYFAIEDDYGNGYVSSTSHLPVYVVNVELIDSITSVLNPATLANASGFYTIPSGKSVRLILSTNLPDAARPNLPDAARPNIRLNVQSDLKSLTPNWGSASSFLPAVTAFRNGKMSFATALQAEFTALTVGSLISGKQSLYVYTQDSDRSVHLNFGVDNQADNPSDVISSIVANVAGANAGTLTLTSPTIVLGADAANTTRISSTGIQTNQSLSIYNTGLTTRIAGFDSDGRLMLDHGAQDSPSLYFSGNGITTGLYYMPEYINDDGHTDNTYHIDALNGIGVSINGRTALFIARDGTNDSTAGITEPRDCSLLILQSYSASSKAVTYYIGINDDATDNTAVPGEIVFASMDGHTPLDIGLDLDFHALTARTEFDFITAKQILGKKSSPTSSDESKPAYAFLGNANTGIFYVDAWHNSDSSAAYSNGVGISINGHTSLLLTKDSSTAGITGLVANPLILNQTSDGTNIVYEFVMTQAVGTTQPVGAMQFGYVGPTGGKSLVLTLDYANNEVVVGAPVHMGQNNIYLGNAQQVVLTRSGISLALSSQKLDFTATQLLLGSDVSSGFPYILVSKTTGGSIDLHGIGATNITSPAISLTGGSIDLHGIGATNITSPAISLTGITSVKPTSGDTYARLYLNQGTQRGFVVVDSNSIFLGLDGLSLGDDTQKIAWGTLISGSGYTDVPIMRGYLSTSGHVYGHTTSGGVTYGFLATNGSIIAGVGVGARTSGDLFLYGVASINANVLLNANGGVQTTTVTAASGITVTSGDIQAHSGNIYASGTVTGGGDIKSTGGSIIADIGDIKSTGGSIIATTGDIVATTGDFVANSSLTNKGHFKTTIGNFLTTDGNFHSINGNLTLDHGNIDAPEANFSVNSLQYNAEQPNIVQPLVLDYTLIMSGGYSILKRMLVLTKAPGTTPTDTTTTIQLGATATVPLVLDGRKTRHIIRLKNVAPPVGIGGWQDPANPGYNQVAPPVLSAGTGGSSPAYGPNQEETGIAGSPGQTTDVMDLALSANASEFDIGHTVKILFMADQLCDENLGLDLIDQSLPGTGLWTQPPPNGSTDYVYNDFAITGADNFYKKFVEYRFVDQVSTDYGYYDDAHGFELTLIRVPNETGFTSVPVDGTNWVSYITRFGKR